MLENRKLQKIRLTVLFVIENEITVKGKCHAQALNGVISGLCRKDLVYFTALQICLKSIMMKLQQLSHGTVGRLLSRLLQLKFQCLHVFSDIMLVGQTCNHSAECTLCLFGCEEEKMEAKKTIYSSNLHRSQFS